MGQPERVPIRRLQQHASEIIAHVEAGHRVEITRNGRLVAVLTPPDREETAWHDLVERGLVDEAHDRRGGLSGWHTPPGRTSVPLSEALAAIRDEESHR